MATFMGFGSPVVGKTEVLYDVELVKRGLLNHFYTRKGERVMDSEYGFIGWDLIFELDTPGVPEMIESDARRIIDMEPRVNERLIQLQKIEYGYILNIELYFVTLDTVDTLSVAFDQRSMGRMQ